MSIVDPQGPAARAIADLWWIVVAVGLGVFAAVTALVLVASFRRRDGLVEEDALAGERWVGDGNLLIIGGGVALPIVVVVVLQLLSVSTAVQVRSLSGNPTEPLVIEVTGHKFWWDVVYPELGIRTANEVHLPVGQPARVDVTSADVIHSFWVPQLAGKIDMTPGHATSLDLQADQPGTYRGLCTEYCGIQHARMQFVVVALEADAFEAWVAQRQEPPTEPEGAAREGLEVFEAQQCVVCHTIQGVSPHTELGPDLSHLADRSTLAAGTLENNRGNLAGWIVDPQQLKPGSRMPPTNVSGEELQALLAYLEGLR